jgi:hypothetical protein
MSTSESGLKGEDSDKSESQHDDHTTAIDPRQWPNKVRRGAAITMGVFAFLEPFASSMIAPSLPLIAEEFGITSSVERSVSTQIYMWTRISGTHSLTRTACSLVVPLTLCIWDSPAGACFGEHWTQTHSGILSWLLSDFHDRMRIRSEQRPAHCLQSPGRLWRLRTSGFGCCSRG